MTPRQFLHNFRVDDRLATGRYFPSGVLDLDRNGHVGVVLMGLGGPHDRSEMDALLYARWMDPILDARRAFGWHRMMQAASRASARFVWPDYEEIGGECPSNRLVREQASALQEALNERLGPFTGARFSTHIAMRYGSPSSKEALADMVARGVNQVVLIPTYPQYSMSKTGTCLAYWSTMISSHSDESPPVAAVVEYSAHPKYLQSVSERMDQALQRFPKRLRRNVEIVFCAEHASTRGRMRDQDSLCELARTTVSRLADVRDDPGPYHVACFHRGARQAARDERSMRLVVERLVKDGTEAVLVVPLGVATDDVWTACSLDIQLRQVARDLGIGFYEVASGLNCHPLFINALADMVGAQFSGERKSASDALVVKSVINPRSSAIERVSERSPECPTCRGPVRAHDWDAAPSHGATSR